MMYHQQAICMWDPSLVVTKKEIDDVKTKLIVIMEQVNGIVQRPIGETASFGLDQQDHQRRAYTDLVMARHLAHQARILEDHP